MQKLCSKPCAGISVFGLAGSTGLAWAVVPALRDESSRVTASQPRSGRYRPGSTGGGGSTGWSDPVLPVEAENADLNRFSRFGAENCDEKHQIEVENDGIRLWECKGS